MKMIDYLEIESKSPPEAPAAIKSTLSPLKIGIKSKANLN